MSILGKLLIVFNLLAAGAFTYFTLNDWKARQDLTRAAFDRQVLLQGIPVEAPAVPPKDLDDKRVTFNFKMPNGPHYTTIKKDHLDALIPKGGEKFGGPAVGDQTEEIKRLQKKVLESLPAEGQDPRARFAEVRGYLLSLARTGAERDGVNALYELLDQSRARAARRDLPYLARTSSQTAALETANEIANLGDPQAIMPAESRATRIRDARAAVSRFLTGEAGHGVSSAGDKLEAERNLKNKIAAATADGAGDAQKKELTDAATGDAAGWAFLASAAVEPLADKPSCDRAITALADFAKGKAETNSEKAVIDGIRTIISPPALGFVLNKAIEDVGLNHLNSKFDLAAMPAGSKSTNATNPQVEKAHRIAHVLYHIDGWRHADRRPESVADRKAWHERVATIVGLPEYIRAAESQASEYAEAAQRLVALITEEQSAFESEYQGLLQKCLALYAQWLTLDNQLKAQNSITNENVRLKEERQTERDNLLNELANATEAAKKALENLKKTQTDLYTIQKQLRDAQAAILVLEKELRKLELGHE